MVGKKSTAVISAMSYYIFMTSIVVILHMNIPTAEHEKFMIHLTTKHWRNTLCIREKKKKKGFWSNVLVSQQSKNHNPLCLQQVTEMRII